MGAFNSTEAQIVTISSYYYHYYQDPFVFLIIHFYCVVKIHSFFCFKVILLKCRGIQEEKCLRRCSSTCYLHVLDSCRQDILHKCKCIFTCLPQVYSVVIYLTKLTNTNFQVYLMHAILYSYGPLVQVLLV